jgi:hypothetical protein
MRAPSCSAAGAPVSRYRRSPRALALALEPARERWAPPTLLGDVQAVWAQAAGDAIAAASTPVSERGGILTVACAAAVWAQELELLSSAIIARLNELLGEGRIKRLRCVCTPIAEGGDKASRA